MTFCPDSRYRLAIPDTPPELVSPDSTSYSSTRQQEQQGQEQQQQQQQQQQPEIGDRDRPWHSVVPISPPMSNYDPTPKAEMLSRKGQDGTQTRGDAGGSLTGPRQSLPPLSSLFGPPPPTSQVRPLHSPQSERLSSYTPASPLDRAPGSAGSLERSLSPSSSYFPSTASSATSQPRNFFEARFEDRPTLPPLGRSRPGPISPHSRQDSLPFGARSAFGLSLGVENKWRVPDANPNEYSPSGRDAHAPKIGSGRLLHGQLPGPKYEDGPMFGFKEQPRTPQTSTRTLLSTPGITAVPEGMPVKDGLGPKIWTGSQFLPRFVKAAEVPGEGLCYFYDDGSHCKTVIDGEAVNAHWGVTKAGKPRKRLAIACVTCREKKIKCDPDYPRCVQCEKFGRVCRFKNAPRGGHNTSPSTSPADVEEARFPGSATRMLPEQTQPGSHSAGSMSPPTPTTTTTIRPASPEPYSGVPSKRARLDYETSVPAVRQQSPVRSIPVPVFVPETTRSAVPWHQPELPRLSEEVLYRAWQTDPYVTDPQSVLSTVTSFFVHADATSVRFLPEKPFKAWLQSSSAHSKSPGDLMLVFSILAAGVALSGGPRNVAHDYAQVARYAAEHSAASLQLVQARLVLSLYYLAVGQPADAEVASSAAIAAASGLQLNLEIERTGEAAWTTFPYGLSRTGYAECRRRTFWSCLVLERLNGLFPARVGIINAEDVFLRLPGDVKSFEAQLDVATPTFEPNFSSKQNQHRLATMGVMGFLVQIVVICGEVMASIYRLSNRGPHHDFDYVKFHNQIFTRVEDWKASLPRRFFYFSAANLEAAASEDRGSLILMHLVHHFTMVQLHRFISRSPTTPSRRQYALLARDHAQHLLDVVCNFAHVAGRSSTGGTPTPPPLFTGFAVLTAVDVLSAEGALADLPGLVDGLATARSVLELLVPVWDDTRAQLARLDARLDLLGALRDRGGADDAAASASPLLLPLSLPGVRVFINPDENRERRLAAGPCWQMLEPLVALFPREMDCVYPSGSPVPASGGDGEMSPVAGAVKQQFFLGRASG